MYHDEHVVIGTVNHGYACLGLTEVHCAAMVLRVIGKEHQRGSRKGEDFGPWFAEPSSNKLAGPSEGGFAGQIGAIVKWYRIFPWQYSLMSLSRKTQRAFSSRVCLLSLAVTHRHVLLMS